MPAQPTPGADGPTPAPTRRRLNLPTVSAETLALAVAVYLTVVANTTVWRQVFDDRSWSQPGTWLFAACLGTAVAAIQFALIVLPLSRWTARPWLIVVLAVSAFASYFVQTYNVFLDPPMLRSVLRTQPKEAGELLSWGLLPHVAWQALLPILLVWWVPLRRHSWRRAALQRVGSVVAAVAVCALALMLVFQDAAALARNHREWRYQVTPANVIYSLGRVASFDASAAAKPRTPIGLDAKLGPRAAQREKPALLVLVVGETARAANWGLSGYARATTPELAAMDVINFTNVTSCGTNTEISLPCLFAPVGRRDYNESRIRGEQGLLHVLDRAGIATLWRDNQTGCKGVCEGLPVEQVDSLTTPGLCEDGRCYDEILIDGLETRLKAERRSRAIVLHMLGSHGPAYYRRYPPAFRRFEPTCDTDELHKCERETIANAYDNTLLYTDHVLAQTVRLLQRLEPDYDTAMIYVSDHGESLGENGLYLHGVPYAIAPDEQTHVPMVLWFSTSWQQHNGLDAACLRRRAGEPASHDHIFHTVLGLLDVQTALHDPRFDLSRDCTRGMAR